MFFLTHYRNKFKMPKYLGYIMVNLSAIALIYLYVIPPGFSQRVWDIIIFSVN